MMLGAATNLFLPETLHRKLPESVEECEEQHRALRLKHYLTCCVEKPPNRSRVCEDDDDAAGALDMEELETLKQKNLRWNRPFLTGGTFQFKL